MRGLNADRSVSAACQCASGESLDGDCGVSDHEEQLSDHEHAVGFLNHQGGLGVAQAESQAAANRAKNDGRRIKTTRKPIRAEQTRPDQIRSDRRDF